MTRAIIVIGGVVAVVGAIVAAMGPEMRRYMKMRSM
jgi:hypothetical protein